MRLLTPVIAFVSIATLAACSGGSNASKGPPSNVTTTTDLLAVDSQATACVAWALLWPTIDRATATGDVGPLSSLVADGGPRHALYGLSSWAAAQLDSVLVVDDSFPEDVTSALHQLNDVGSGGATAPLRAAAEIVNVDCKTEQSVPSTTAPATTVDATNATCEPGDLTEAFADQSGSSNTSVRFDLSSCSADWAIASSSGSVPLIAIFAVVGKGFTLKKSAPITDGKVAAASVGMSSVTYEYLIASLQGCELVTC